MHNPSQQRCVKVAPDPGDINRRKIIVHGMLWGWATNHHGSWFIESATAEVCGHAKSERAIRHVVAINLRSAQL